VTKPKRGRPARPKQTSPALRIASHANLLYGMVTGKKFESYAELQKEMSYTDLKKDIRALDKKLRKSNRANPNKDEHLLNDDDLKLAILLMIAEAIRAERANSYNVAIQALCNGYWMYGCLATSEGVSNSQKMQKQEAAKARHAEHYLIRQAVIDYYEANKHSFHSNEQAAREIAKREPVRPRTISAWISSHKRKL
jgi:hypothetical protein